MENGAFEASKARFDLLILKVFLTTPLIFPYESIADLSDNSRLTVFKCTVLHDYLVILTEFICGELS